MKNGLAGLSVGPCRLVVVLDGAGRWVANKELGFRGATANIIS